VKARKARWSTNSFTSEPALFKGRPASKTAKVTGLQKPKGCCPSELALTGSTPPPLSQGAAHGSLACLSETVRVGPYSAGEQTGAAFYVAAVG
jgi:hypothetical protein